MSKKGNGNGERISSPIDWFASSLGRILISIFVPALTFIGLWQGFLFLRDSEAPQVVTALVAIIWGVGGVAILYIVSNWLIELLPDHWTRRLSPFVFVGPAVAILTWFLFLPTIRTFYLSLFNNNSTVFVGLQNYVAAFTERSMIESFRNNLYWLVIGTSLSVIFGLLIAVLADRSSFESIAKSLIFLPMAISFVGAGVIWRFIYYYRPANMVQTGLLNAIVTLFGGEPQAWTTLLQPWNNFFLIVIMVWLQTGYAMVIFSSAIKGVPEELLEAARVDGANEFQIFFKIIIPQIQGTIITVTTTIVIFSLKIFDVVLVMTGGQYGTEVIATQFYRQFFSNRNFGYGSAISIVLLIAVIPIMIYNLSQFGKREVFK
ncbi:MAG: sugar ABC transporter permease [Chloroflexi bacterium]|nr:sugar ABC transporter permease [Chloroflexota bacterium]